MADRTLTDTDDIDVDESVTDQVRLLLKPRAFTALTDGATITWATGGADRVKASVTLGGNRTLSITGATNGQEGTLIVKQDATGSRTLALPGLEVGGGVTLSTAANAVDILAYVYDGTNYHWTLGKGFA